MTVRLPPQPVDTALSRAVRRLIDRLPGATIGQRRWIEDALARSQVAERRACVEASEARREAYQRAEEMRHMAMRFASANRMPLPMVDRMSCVVADDTLTSETVYRLAIDFQPVRYAFLHNGRGLEKSGRLDLDQAVRDNLKHAASKMAAMHADEVAKAIFDHASRKCGVCETTT